MMGFFGSISVRSKMLLVVTLPLVALIALGIIAIRDMGAISVGGERLYQDRIVPLQLLKGINDGYGLQVLTAAGKVRAGVLDPVNAARSLQSAREQILDDWDSYQNMGHSPEEMMLVNKVGEAVRGADDAIARMQAFLEQESAGLAEADVELAHLYEVVEPVSKQVKALINEELTLAAQDHGEMQALFESTKAWFIVGAIISLLVVGLVSFMVFRVITKPIRALRNTFQAVETDVDLNIRAPVYTRDGIGITAVAFNNMMDSFQRLVGSISNSTTALGQATQDLSSISAQTGEAAASQQSETEHVAAAMNQMSATVQDIARSAAEAAQAAQLADQQTQTGDRVVKSVISSIQALANEVQSTGEAVGKLEEETLNIGSVLDVIRNIAEQTNLLALNAAIEAARAGEQGRGFAVVADEVRTLASRTQKSTQEIQEMIENLQNGARTAVQAMEQGQEHAQQTAGEAREAGDALAEARSAVATISDMNTQIASAAEEQGAVAEEISRNISNISDLSSQTAEGAERTSVAVASLTQLSSELQSQAARYKI